MLIASEKYQDLKSLQSPFTFSLSLSPSLSICINLSLSFSPTLYEHILFSLFPVIFNSTLSLILSHPHTHTDKHTHYISLLIYIFLTLIPSPFLFSIISASHPLYLPDCLHIFRRSPFVTVLETNQFSLIHTSYRTHIYIPTR